MTTHPILYDPDCGFCRVCVAVLLRWDRHGRLRPVSLRSTEAEALLEGMPEDERMASWHLVDARWWGNGAENATDPHHLGRAGALWSAGAAFSPLFRLLPGGAALARLTDRFPEASNRAYRWVADHRTAFGKPLPAAAKRWADRVISESRADSR
jgi:predicted DCC family thiol-disulfide oxidoreductase YuxK